MSVPDLLFSEATCRLDPAAVAHGIAFAFAAGEGRPMIEKAVDASRLAPSTFDPVHFGADLFLDALVRGCFVVQAGGRTFAPNRAFIANVLAHPPRDPASCALRRDVLLELATKPAVRTDLEKTYVELRSFRDLLFTQATASAPEQHQHRIEILRALRAVIAGLATRFEAATSALQRLHAFGSELHQRPGFEHLSELVSYEDGLANVDVRLRLGGDGSVRSFELSAIRESRESRFYRAPLTRFWSRVVLFFRGYRFGELEVMARLLDQVFTPFEDDVAMLVQLLGDIEVYLGALGFRDLATSRGLDVCLPEIVPPATDPDFSARDLRGLFNPLLLADRGAPKPCDVGSARHDAIVLVTGPNSGGKTRLLQALAIAQLLGQAGLFVPARAARIAWTEGLFVSLHHEVTAGQKEGRLGTELLRIRTLFEELRPGDLVLFDELCSGTNPTEAEAIIRLVLELLSELNPQVFVTTHFLDFASELEQNPHVERLEFLQAALDERNRPTYAFVPGVAKSALAAETAARLGVTLEELAAIVARRKAERPRPEALPEQLSEARNFTRHV